METSPICQSATCSKCGAPLQGAVLFCPSCGKEISHPCLQGYRPKKKLSRKAAKWIISGALVLFLAVGLVLLWCFTGGAATPEGAMELYFALYDGDLSKLERLAPNEYWLNRADNDYISKEEVLEKQSETIQERLDKLHAHFGDYTVNYTIIEEYDLDADELKTINREMGSGVPDTDNAKTYRIGIAIRGTKASSSYITNFTVVQILGKWYLLRGDSTGAGFALTPVMWNF